MKVYTLIITYHPNMSVLCNTVASLEKQIDGICIIDNGGLIEEELPNLACDLLIKHLDSNQGIAKATNIGFDLLSGKSVDFILLSDQDTLFPCDYIKTFLNYIEVNDVGSVLAFCPIVYDTHSAEYKPIYIKKNGFIRKMLASENPSFVFQTIASGLIIDTSKYKETGGMNEDLFIDYVDFEWCWRLNKTGFKVLCLPQLKIFHCLGDDAVSIMSKRVSRHTPTRNYYITRNTSYLSLHCKYLPLSIRVQLFFKACMYPIGYTLLCKPRIINAAYTIKGMVDGICGKLGKISEM